MLDGDDPLDLDGGKLLATLATTNRLRARARFTAPTTPAQSMYHYSLSGLAGAKTCVMHVCYVSVSKMYVKKYNIYSLYVLDGIARYWWR